MIVKRKNTTFQCRRNKILNFGQNKIQKQNRKKKNCWKKKKIKKNKKTY